jgi:hypothetical protein
VINCNSFGFFMKLGPAPKLQFGEILVDDLRISD